MVAPWRLGLRSLLLMSGHVVFEKETITSRLPDLPQQHMTPPLNGSASRAAIFFGHTDWKRAACRQSLTHIQERSRHQRLSAAIAPRYGGFSVPVFSGERKPQSAAAAPWIFGYGRRLPLPACFPFPFATGKFTSDKCFYGYRKGFATWATDNHTYRK